MNKFIGCCLSLLVVGCSSVGVTTTKQAPAKPDNCHLDVFVDKSDIKRPHETVCFIDSRTGSTLLHDKSAAGAIRNSKPEACSCGADGILIESADTEGLTFGRYGMGKAIIKGFRYTD